jgi:type I restriction enzyme S subunit
MAGEWRVRPVGDLTENFDGRRVPVKEADRRPGPYPYYGASGVVDHVDDYLFDGEYLLIAEDGENLRTSNTPVAFLARGKFWVNNHAHIVRGNDQADTRYLMYALRATDVTGYLTGSTMPKLTQGSLNRILLPAPEVSEQRAIAHILGTLDDKIQLNRRMSETREAMARALFQSWFVDFGPVRAKAEGRDAGLPTEIANLFPDRFEDSELEDIPAEWGVAAFSEIVELVRDQENPLDSPEAVFSHYSIPAFDEGQQAKREIGASIKSLKFRVPAAVVLLSKLNPDIERVWLVDVEPGERSVCSTEFLVLRARPPFSRGYVYCLVRSARFRQELQTLITGTSKSHQRAQADPVLKLTIPLPPEPLARAFDRTVAAALEGSIACRRESGTLAALRDTLLPKLISGELRVADAERLVSAEIP